MSTRGYSRMGGQELTRDYVKLVRLLLWGYARRVLGYYYEYIVLSSSYCYYMALLQLIYCTHAFIGTLYSYNFKFYNVEQIKQ